jgi:pimeloyl-ACP methyl ester carboxylesterase
MATEVELDVNGRARLARAAITVSAPGWSGVARLRDRAPSGTRARGEAEILPHGAFNDAAMNVEADLEIRAAPDRRGSHGSRGGSAGGAIKVTLDSPRQDRDYALLQRDPSGLLRWKFPEGCAGRVTFSLAEPTQDGGEAEGDKRGPITATMRIGARIVSWATDGVTGKLAREVAQAWERRRRPYFLRSINHDGLESEPDWDTLTSGRTLLLVHGTFSTPAAGFSGLFSSEEFSTILALYGGRCLAFAHPSMGANIDDNVDHLIAHLSKELPRAGILDVDIVAHSRGGLVSRAIAAAAKGGKLPLRVSKLVMVGAPNRGTPLTEAKHWKDFIDRYTNLLVTLPDGVLTVALEGVLCLVKIIGGGAVEGLPGLAAMHTAGEMLAALKKKDLGDVRLYAMVADFSPDQKSALAMLRRGGKDAVDAFFDEANDLVVPTKGCHDLTDTKGFPLAIERIHQFSGGAVNHVNFFQWPDVRRALASLLVEDD